MSVNHSAMHSCPTLSIHWQVQWDQMSHLHEELCLHILQEMTVPRNIQRMPIKKVPCTFYYQELQKPSIFTMVNNKRKAILF